MTRSFQCTQNGIASASAFLDEVLSSVDPAKLSPLHIVLDEACSNIVNHSDASSFEIEIAPRDGGAVLTFADDGKPYNPLAHEDPDTSAPAEKRPIGGLGIMIIKKLASAVSYRRANNHNFLTVDCTFGAAKKA